MASARVQRCPRLPWSPELGTFSPRAQRPCCAPRLSQIAPSVTLSCGSRHGPQGSPKAEAEALPLARGGHVRPRWLRCVLRLRPHLL